MTQPVWPRQPAPSIRNLSAAPSPPPAIAFPAATCLPRALATRYLLRRRGIDSDLQLGVARSAAGTFEAHAWLTCGGETVVGELSDRAYAPLLKAS